MVDLLDQMCDDILVGSIVVAVVYVVAVVVSLSSLCQLLEVVVLVVVGGMLYQLPIPMEVIQKANILLMMILINGHSLLH